MPTHLTPAHPGSVLREEFVTASGLSARELGRALGVSHQTICSILSCRRPISKEIALLLDAYFRMSSGFFSRLQHDYDQAVLTQCDHMQQRVADVIHRRDARERRLRVAHP